MEEGPTFQFEIDEVFVLGGVKEYSGCRGILGEVKGEEISRWQ